MGVQVVSGAGILCSMGAPGTLIATSQMRVLVGGAPAATIQDVSPMANITPCGMCRSPANPTVASATAAALGVLTPMPCIPAPAGMWVCPGTVLIGGIPALKQDGTLLCSYGGSITITNPGQSTVLVG